MEHNPSCIEHHTQASLFDLMNHPIVIIGSKGEFGNQEPVPAAKCKFDLTACQP